jgi:hypothetical protein
MGAVRPRLKVGSTCINGHEIREERDLAPQGGRKPPRCKQCRPAKLYDQLYKRKSGTERTYIHFHGCAHRVIFEVPLPVADDIVFCRPCREYRVVEKWGEPVPLQRTADTPGEEEVSE